MVWDAIVIGAGVVGLAAAWTLARSGMGRVLVLERRAPAAGASGLGAGSVTVQRWRPEDVALVRRSQELMDELSARTAGAFRFHRVGRLTLVGPGHAEQLRRYGEMIRGQGIELHYLDGAELERRFPGLCGGDVGLAAFTPRDGYVHPPALVWALAGVARDAGVTIWEGAAAQRLASAGGRVRGVVVGGEPVEAPRVLLAAGAWSRAVLQASGLDIPLKAYRLQVLFALARQPGPWPVVLDLIQDTYFVPRNPGTLLAGGGNRPIEGPPEAQPPQHDPELVDELYPKLRHRFPGAGLGPVTGGWAGVTDTTPDGHPLIGAYGGVDGLYVACGLAGYGVMRGPAVGEAAARLLLRQEPGIDLSAYRADRYAGFFDFPVSFAEYNPFRAA